MTKDERIKALEKFTWAKPSSDSWSSNAVVPRTQDLIDSLNHAQIISTPWEYSAKPWEPTERQLTLSRLLGRPWKDFIP